jgi:hypothetical protein
MENQFLFKKKHKLFPCNVIGIKYTDFEGELGFRMIIEIDRIKLKTNRLKDITSLDAMYNKKQSHPILIKDYDLLNRNDFVYFVDNDAEFIHKLNRNCEWKPNMSDYFNRIGQVTNVFNVEGIKFYTVSFNKNTSFRILDTCLYQITPRLKTEGLKQ